MIHVSSAPMQMPNGGKDIWLPQKHILGGYHHPVPPDVVPHYDESNDWHTIPRTNISKKKTSHRPPSFDGTGNVKLKDYIELTKTVKNSLILSENDEMNAKDDSPSYPPERPPMHSTYKMPPLTPTVANLIHTSSVVKKSYSHLGSSSKVMKPVYKETTDDEINDISQDTIERYRKRSSTSRDTRVRNDGRLPNRNFAIREEGTVNHTNVSDQTTPNARYSWSCSSNESATNFGKTLARSTYSTGAMPGQLQRNQSASKMKPVVPVPTPNNYPPSDYYRMNSSVATSPTTQFSRESVNSVSTSPTSPVAEQSTSFSRSTLKKNSSGPPPPPRRSPNTKLSQSGMEKRYNSSSPATSQQSSASCSRASSMKSSSSPYEIRQPDPAMDSRPLSPERNAPPQPPHNSPPSSQTQNTRDNRSKHPVNPNAMNLPAPPPPPPNSNYDEVVLKNRNFRKISSTESACGFPLPPPPPPTM